MHGSNAALRLFTQTTLNILIVWAMVFYLPEYFVVEGGIVAYIVVGALITLLNLFARPIIYLISLPFRMFALILGIIIANGLFVQLLYEISSRFDQNMVIVDIRGGIVGWIVIAICFGLANWLMRLSLK
jgi:uncharacterized membrane protein YvlD (DUF360 family)